MEPQRVEVLLYTESIRQRGGGIQHGAETQRLSQRQEVLLKVQMAFDIGTDEAVSLGNFSCRQRFGDGNYFEFRTY